jgi:RNA polymerase sigma factor (sigma-70 family)
MTTAASGALAATKALDSLARNDRGRLLAALIARLRDFQLAEEVLQDAMISAVSHWGRAGVPASPKGWLLQVAYRKAVDRIRQRKSDAKVADDMALRAEEAAQDDDPEAIPDERLRLIFTCCHPAIEPKSQVALTLRTLGGLSTPEIARAFLDQETTMGQRLSRAKAKIAAAGIPYAVPEPEAWPQRLKSVLAVIYLIFNAGYTAGLGQGRDLAEEAIWLGRMLDGLRPADPEIEGCLALMLLTQARRAARVDPHGFTVPLTRQDRGLWDRKAITEGAALVERALGRGDPGPYQIKAAIAACHCEGEQSDWLQIVALYHVLLAHEPTPVVRLNRAVAVAECGGLAEALAELELLGGRLVDYQPFHAARAELLARSNDKAGAQAAYAKAISLAHSCADAAFLTAKLNELTRLSDTKTHC